jgi:hypothetical protein
LNVIRTLIGKALFRDGSAMLMRGKSLTPLEQLCGDELDAEWVGHLMRGKSLTCRRAPWHFKRSLTAQADIEGSFDGGRRPPGF